MSLSVHKSKAVLEDTSKFPGAADDPRTPGGRNLRGQGVQDSGNGRTWTGLDAPHCPTPTPPKAQAHLWSWLPTLGNHGDPPTGKAHGDGGTRAKYERKAAGRVWGGVA